MAIERPSFEKEFKNGFRNFDNEKYGTGYIRNSARQDDIAISKLKRR